jgi:hypothetical protein
MPYVISSRSFRSILKRIFKRGVLFLVVTFSACIPCGLFGSELLYNPFYPRWRFLQIILNQMGVGCIAFSHKSRCQNPCLLSLTHLLHDEIQDPFDPGKSPFNPQFRPFNVYYFTCGASLCYRRPCVRFPPAFAATQARPPLSD